ncbi:specifically androgen-regulated gene protein isoform X2 [Brachyhypopomus gauderio]|uniref:specifically androgen-regulated gene protein isoform X2 n=1 Tax=Brachyhypopomus gauderio TaxID=698409 RepID=UPI0040412766
MPACDGEPCSSSMNSGSSCDSMVSINSGFSDDSMEHLSAEERACLMFLEETIESLETEDDSGLSNDEPSWPPHTLDTRMGHLASPSPTKPEELQFHNDSSRGLGSAHKPHGLLVPTPLVLANGDADVLKKTVHEANTSALNSYHPSAAQVAVKPPSLPQNSEALKPTAEPPSFIPEPPVKTGSTAQPKAKDSPPKLQLDLKPDHQSKVATPDMPMVLIPPPSDFMDEPNQPLPQPQSQSQSQLPPQPQTQPPVENAVIAPPSGFGMEPRDDASLSAASATPALLTPGACHDAPQQIEPKSPPAVAPKPKKLPSNIMKSHKEPGPSHSLVSASDRTMMNPQKVHIEALKKLGLLKDNEPDLSPAISQPQKVPSPLPVSTGTTSVPPAAETMQTPGKTVSHLSSPPLQEKGGRQSPLIPRDQSPRVFEFKSATIERSVMGPKSHAAEQSSTTTCQGKTPEKPNVELSPGQVRRNWSRPVSTGSLRDLSIHKAPFDSNQDPKIRRSLQTSTVPTTTQQSTDTQKTTRTHGISVVISPQSKNGEDRKQALRKLGLIRD